MTDQEREIRKLRKALKDLSNVVLVTLIKIDYVMAKAESNQRGKLMGQVAGSLELANDLVRHFVFGAGIKKPRKPIR